MKKLLATMLAFLFCTPLMGTARAWNSAGHMTVALLAYRQLSDGAKLKVAEILRRHPHYDLYLSKHQPAGVTLEEWVFLRAATWPDFVRPPHPHDIVKYHKGEWHFIDLPFVPDRLENASLRESDLQPQGETALSALKDCLAKLKVESTSPEDRAVCLCWVLHLLGDIHQPLHCSKLYSAQFPLPQGDRGGNFFFVPNRRNAPNLHHYWDELLGKDEHYSAVDLTATDLQHAARFSRNNLPELQKLEIEDWIKESHTYAVNLAYRRGRLAGLNLNVDPHHHSEDVAPLTIDYERSAEEAARRRGALAGHRLADQLKAAFGGP